MNKAAKFSVLFASASMAIALGASIASSNKTATVRTRADATVIEGNNASNSEGQTITTGIYFKLDANDVPYNASSGWDMDYRMVAQSADNIKLTRDGVTTSLARTDTPVLVKYSSTFYYCEFSRLSNTTLGVQEYDEWVIEGNFVPSNNSDIVFHLNSVYAYYIGGRWITTSYELEAYDTITLKDAMYGESPIVSGSTAIDNTNVAQHRFTTSAANTTNSVALRMKYTCTGITSDGSGTASNTYIWLRNDGSGWFGYRFIFVSSWRVITVSKQVSDAEENKLGEHPSIPEAGHEYDIELAAIDYKNSDKVLLYTKVDGVVTQCYVTTQISDYKDNVVSNYIDDKTGATTIASVDQDYLLNQDLGTDGIVDPVASSGHDVYFRNFAANDIPFGWEVENRFYAMDPSAIKYNGVAVAKIDNANLSFFKVENGTIYLSSTWFANNNEPVKGDTIEVDGTFRCKTSEGAYYVVTLKAGKAVYNGTYWMAAADSSVIESGSLMANLGGWRADGTKNCVKNLDQTPTTAGDMSTIVYTKDGEGHGAYYFSHTGEQTTASEFRFCLPGNAYKAENNDTPIKSFSFHYMLKDANTEVGTEGGTTYIDGQEGTAASSTTTSYMIQYNAVSGAKYYCYDANLVNDGCWHDFTLNVACPTVNSINIKLFRFNGSIIVSDVKVVYDEDRVAVKSFIANYMHMSDVSTDTVTDTGACKGDTGYYAVAKAAIAGLTDAQRVIFATDSAYAAAYARMQAWAVANGETFSINTSTGAVTTARVNLTPAVVSGNNTAALIAVASLISVLALAAFLSLKKRKHN